MPGLPEAALRESEYFRRANRKHERGPGVVAKAIVINGVSLGSPRVPGVTAPAL
jgi:hypothetical protein